jgi:hypothetical protein
MRRSSAEPRWCTSPHAPNADSLPRLIRARCVETHEAKLEDRRDLNMMLLAVQEKKALKLAA